MRIGEYGIRTPAHVKRSDSRELLDERLHFIRTERTIQTNDEWLGVRDGDKKRFHGLTAQGPSGPIRDRARNHERKVLSGLLENLRDREERRLRVERVEDCFYNQKIDASCDQRAYLIEISLSKLIERDRTKRGIVHVGRNRCCDRQRSQ